MSSQLELGSATPIRLGDLAALTAGAPDAPPVLLVPGYTGTKEDFGPIMDAIAAAGLRPVAIDLPGQYESPGPADPEAYSTAALGTRLIDVVDRLGGRVHVLGHSFGGLVARAAVIAAPGHFLSLVLMDSGPAGLGGARADLIAQLEPLLASVGVEGVYDAVESLYRSAPGYVAPAPALAAMLRARFVAGSAAMLSGMGLALRTEPDRVDELRAVGIDTLVLYGADDDAWVPTEQDAMAARLGAEVVAIPAAIHSPAVENPGPTAAALTAFWLDARRRVTLSA